MTDGERHLRDCRHQLAFSRNADTVLTGLATASAASDAGRQIGASRSYGEEKNLRNRT